MEIILYALVVIFAAMHIWRAFKADGQLVAYAKWRIVAIVTLLVIAASCLRFEIFASPSAPPSSGWNSGPYAPFKDVSPLENIPIVEMTTPWGEGVAVTIANRGSTPFEYLALPYDHRKIEQYQELDAERKWIPGFQGRRDMGDYLDMEFNYDAIKSVPYEIAPGTEVELHVKFYDPRRERMLGYFKEKGTNRSGLVVLASEDRRVRFSFDLVPIVLSSGIAAFGIWLAIRIVNLSGQRPLRHAGPHTTEVESDPRIES